MTQPDARTAAAALDAAVRGLDVEAADTEHDVAHAAADSPSW